MIDKKSRPKAKSIHNIICKNWLSCGEWVQHTIISLVTVIYLFYPNG